jgi:hypothetical protein
MKKFLAVVLEMTIKAMAKITFSCAHMARHGIAFPFRAVIGLAALSLLNCFAFGQPFSGPGVFSGNTQFGAPGGGGAPLTYSARTDGCVNPTATPSSCVGGTTTGQAGATLLFQEGVSDPIPTGFAATTISSGVCPSGLTPASYPASCVAPINASATDPDFNSYLVMASDDTLQNNGNPWLVSWNGGSVTFSMDESLMALTASNGNATIMNVGPISIHAKTCASSPCVNKTGIFYASSGSGDSTHLAHGSSIFFSRNSAEPTTLYEQIGTLVSKLVISSSIASPGTGTLTRATYADFANGSGGYGGVLPSFTVGACTNVYTNSWTGNFNVSNDGSVGYGMTGGYDWCTGWTPADVIGNTIFIQPSVNNSANHGFQATTITGTTGGSEPNWATCSPTCSDGGVTWTDIGVVQGQGPGFDIVFYGPPGSAAPGYSRVNTRLAKIYRGTGNSAAAGQITTMDPVACTRATGAPCTSTPVNLPDEYTLHAAPNLMRGGWMRFGPTGGEAMNNPGNWNSGTLTCQPNGAADLWAGAWSSGTTYTSKQTVSSGGFYYVATTAAGNLNHIPPNSTYWTQQEAYCAHYYWNVATTLVSPTTAWSAVGGHSATRYLYDYMGGTYTTGSISIPSSQLSPPNGPITVNPGTNLLAAALPADDHSTPWNSGTLDLQPVFAVTGDVPAYSGRYTAACYNEVCAAGATGSGPLYRFAHTYNENVNANFSIQDGEGNISPLGDLIAIGTDVMGTRGDLSLETTQCTNTRAMFKAVAGMTLNLNDTVFPVGGDAGMYIFQATVGGLTSGSAPTGGWCQTLNCTATWGAAAVKNIGANTCRGDVVIVDLNSAHAAAGGIQAASCSYSDVNSAVSGAPRNALVNVPAGSCTWTSTLKLTKGVKLQGAGRASTVITDGGITNVNCAGAGGCLIEIMPDSTAIANDEVIKVDGFTLNANNLQTFAILDVLGGGSDSGTKPFKNLVITNNTFKNTNSGSGGGNAGIYTRGGQVRGLLSGNIFDRVDMPFRTFGSDDLTEWNNPAYYNFAYGSADNLFFENNTIQYSSSFTSTDQAAGWIESGQGARLVVRYNTWDETNVVLFPISAQEVWDVHGFQLGGQTSTMIAEYYGNTLNNMANTIFRWFDHRGSWGLYFDNIYTGGSNPDGEVNQYDPGSCNPGTVSPAIWYVNNTYFFNDTANGSGITVIAGSSNSCGVVENTNFWNYNASCTASSCAAGIGRGTTAPTGTCTVGTGYWVNATPTPTASPSVIQAGQFYKCTSTNTWTLYYTPYTYPHP